MVKKKDTVLSVLQEIRDLLQKGSASAAIPAEASKVITDRFTDNGDGTISDKQLKVIWVKDPSKIPALEKTMTFDEAKSACDKLSYAGYNSGWRMPTVEELRSIVDYSRHEPAWNIDVFGGKHDDWYWTSTPCAWDLSGAAWCVSSYYGSVLYSSRYYTNYVRPVRSSQ